MNIAVSIRSGGLCRLQIHGVEIAIGELDDWRLGRAWTVRVERSLGDMGGNHGRE